MCVGGGTLGHRRKEGCGGGRGGFVAAGAGLSKGRRVNLIFCSYSGGCSAADLYVKPN